MKRWLAVGGIVVLLGWGCAEEKKGEELTPEQKQAKAQEMVDYSLDAAGMMVEMGLGVFQLMEVFSELTGSPSPLKPQQVSQCPTLAFELKGDCNSQAGCDVEAVLDWGDGCVGDDGVLRKGKISISAHIDPDSINGTATFDNFEEEGNKITSGNLSVNAEKTQVGWNLTISVEDLNGENEEGRYSLDIDELSFSLDQRGTPDDESDDSLTINGKGKISSDKGSLEITITNVVMDNQVCENNPVSGKVEIKVSSDEVNGTITFNFHETCDGKVDVSADIEVGGSTIKINTSVPLE